jgi:hypothetical protein
MDTESEMLFETTIRIFLGDKAYNIAGQVHSEKCRKEWYQKILKIIIKRVGSIDTSTTHKEGLSYFTESALKVLNEKHFNENKLFLYLLCLIGSLLGFTAIGTTPVYLKTFYTEAMSEGTDVIELMQHYNNNSTSVRKRIINQLSREGFDDFQIALVLNTSEYQIKKLKK